MSSHSIMQNVVCGDRRDSRRRNNGGSQSWLIVVAVLASFRRSVTEICAGVSFEAWSLQCTQSVKPETLLYDSRPANLCKLGSWVQLLGLRALNLYVAVPILPCSVIFYRGESPNLMFSLHLCQPFF